ncbi:ubiquitin-like protein [Colletotrichum tofieldiae]|uniref:Ubiquitin-like protein n=1 Tax=Colletotrichum tofieldiae TaxID=708197 RepID=A0A166NNP7_9PEZI|nr:ubiquitin-like protein [Colletotrichum tofieldiae]
MEGFPRMSRTMSAGPGPPKSPAPHPPRRGHSVTAGRMTRYRSVRSVREHKSVLDFGRDWRDWDVDIFQDDETASNATTDTGTATSIGICIGIAVDEEAILDEAQPDQPSTSGQQQRPAPAARRRTAPLLTSFSPTPQTSTGAPQLTLQWQWHDLLAATTGSDENDDNNNDNDKFAFDRGSPINRGNGAGAGCGVGGAGKRVLARPDSPVRFSYPNRRRPKTAPNAIITKLALQPVADEEHIRTAQWDQHLAREDDQRQRRRQQQRQQAEEEVEDRRRREQEEEDAARWAEEVTRLEEETDRILADQKAKDLARLQAQLDAIPDAPPRVRSPIVDKFASFLRKGRRSDPATLTKASSAYFQPLTLDCRPVSDMDPSRFIQAGGGGIVPQTDAPTSASNAGERRVTIRCLQSSISLPVTPDTTPNEILYSAANLMTHNINPQTSVVLECYFSYGLERRLRRYERVRDVMNSWDRDTQHCLLIVPGDSVDKYPHLNLEGVPRTIDPPPGLVNFVLYHCNRPGKWNKRYITLMESGQVFFSKKKDAKLSDKDAVSLCHLSDFDIYEVTEKDMLKNIRPPKKNCIAIKSQQKNSVFQNTENFIHFFATDDSRLAGDFQRIIHGWRSWYLVNKKVDLTKKTKSHHSSVEKPASTASGLSRNGTVHRTRTSVDETPYTIGTFSPLLDMDKFDKPIDDYGKDSDRPAARPAEQLSTPRQTHKVVSRSRTTHSFSPPAAKKLIDPFAKDQEFRSGGLLGRGYEGRKQQAEKAAEEQHSPDSPFTGGHSLLNQVPEPDRQLPERRGTVRSSRSTAADPTPLPRSRSRPPAPRQATSSRPKTSDGGSSSSGKREMPQPLVDLTPKVPHLPSAWRDAQGRGVKAPNGKPLIEMATGWDQPDAVLGPQLQTVTRMGTAKAYPPQRMASQSAASRPRSRSTAGGGAIRRVVSNEQPPVPSMPRRSSRRDDEDLPLINFVERDRGRDTKPSVAQGLGRSGTVRH